MSFKDMVAQDNKNVFLNADEFAEIRTVIYDGEEYPDIPVVLTKTKENERPAIVGDVQGVHIVAAVAHIAQSDLGGIVPEQKQYINISDGTALGKPFFQKFRIITSDCEMGMLNLELEAYDE